MWDITIHPPFLFPSSNQCRIAPKSTPFGASVLTGPPPRVYPLRGIARRLAHRPVSSSDTICNDPNSPLADIILFGLSLSGSFKTRLLGEGLHTLINGTSHLCTVFNNSTGTLENYSHWLVRHQNQKEKLCCSWMPNMRRNDRKAMQVLKKEPFGSPMIQLQ